MSEQFLALHLGEAPLLLPNPWDRGSARLLASLWFQALATTSSGFAATVGRLDGSVTRDRLTLARDGSQRSDTSRAQAVAVGRGQFPPHRVGQRHVPAPAPRLRRTAPEGAAAALA